MNNSFEKTVMGNHLIENGLLSIVTNQNDWVKVKGVLTKSPIKINYLEMLQNARLEFLIGALAHYLPKDTTMVAGANHGQLLASGIASLKKLPFLPLLTDLDEYIVESKNLINEKVALVSDVIATGTHTASALEVIEGAHGHCSTVLTVFDYNFNLSPKSLQGVKIKSLVNTHDLLQIEAITQPQKEALNNWMADAENKNLFFHLERNLLAEEEHSS